MFENLLGKLRKDIGIDLGTANTLVYVKGRGIIINEPSVVAVNTKTEQILAVGNEAKEDAWQKAPHILTTRPLISGIISDFEVTEKMLKYFIDKVYEDSMEFYDSPQSGGGRAAEITEVELKAINDAVINAGAREVVVVQEPMAAAIGARMPIREPVGSFIVEIGDRYGRNCRYFPKRYRYMAFYPCCRRRTQSKHYSICP